MAKIEGFRIQNFKALKDITIGRIGTDPQSKNNEPLTPLTVVIGKNGVGKSSIFDVLGFLADCMEFDIETASNMRNRGGFDKLLTLGSTELKITIYYKESDEDRPITYEVILEKNTQTNQPIVKEERLRQRRKEEVKYGRPKSFLMLKYGKGSVWIGENSFEGDKIEEKKVELETQKLAIATLAEFTKENPRINKFKNFIKSWYLSYFTPDAARRISQAGIQKHLNLHGDNIGNVVQYYERNHRDKFNKILGEIAEKIPGIGTIETYRDKITNNLYLLFKSKAFETSFTQQQMSDGTLKMFSYLLLLNDPEPAPFICIEEPENGLYHQLLETLANEFREHAEDKESSQVFITTHQPYFVNSLNPNEVWILDKEEDGFSTIRRASEDKLVTNLVKNEIPLGNLWYSNYLDKENIIRGKNKKDKNNKED